MAGRRVLNEPREQGITMHTDLQWDPGHVTLKTEDGAIRPSLDRSQPADRAATREELADSTGRNVASGRSLRRRPSATCARALLTRWQCHFSCSTRTCGWSSPIDRSARRSV